MENQTVTITINQLRTAYETLSRLVGIKLKPKASYWVIRLQSALESEYKLSAKAIDALIVEFGNKDENGGATIDPNNADMVAAVNTAYEPIASTEVTLNNPPMISIESFGDDIEIEPYVWANLAPFLKD